ncbi:major capsid protein, partial [Clostridioides difficile]|uniref:major capsid protein n=2 Tax=Bacteria TaxID=2 RepID=UPI0031B5973B
LSAARLAKVIALSKKVAVGVPALGTAGTVLNSIELHAETLRQKFRLGTSTLEGVAPAWLRSILRADLAYRDDVLPERVTDQILDQHFADRGVRFQWVDDYQP